MKLLAFGITGITVFVFCIVLFVAARRSPGWVRYSFLALALLALSYGTLGCMLELYRTSLTYHSRAILDHYRTFAGGIAIGVFGVLAASGQLKLLVKTREKV